MCVIIQRDPGIVIPEFKINSACHVNPDGFGFSVIDRGKIETIKVWEEGGNKPEDVMKRLEDAKDQEIFLHLRFTTAGKTNQENCHPFTTFKGDDFEVQFMHNGTLYRFNKKDDYPDTYHFNEEILKPLVRAFYEVDGKNVLSNPTLKTIISEFKSGSAFALYDSEGNKLLIEKTESKQHEGWWSSNEYSFNRYHREPAATTTTATSKYANDEDRYESYWNGRYGRDAYNSRFGYKSDYSSKASNGSSYHQNSRTASTTSTIQKLEAEKPKTESAQSKKVGYAIMQAKKNNVSTATHTTPPNRMSFVEMAEIESLDQIMVLTEDELYDIVEDCPLAATALIMDLIHELWTKRQAEKKAKASASVTPLMKATA